MLSEALVASEVCKMLKSAVKQDSLFFFFPNLLVLGLHCGSKASPVTAPGLVALWHMGSYFPDKRSNPNPLPWKADS